MQRIWIQHKETFKEDRRESLSDRRLKKVIKLLCVSAATNGRSEVDLSDVFLLKDCLWNHQDNAPKARDLILNILRSFSRSMPQNEDFASSAIYSELPTYEVSKDGKTLIPTQAQNSAWQVSSAASQASAKLNAVVKGFKGSGTEQDPLLIQTVEDLMDLSRPDVGLKGYYFRQTADINCSSISSWTDISFEGHYDGGGHKIKSKKFQNTNSGGFFSALAGILPGNNVALLNLISKNSTITNLKLEDIHLATTIKDSHITHCISNIDLIRDRATGSTITKCQTDASLIGNVAADCTITACKSGFIFINGTCINCTITNCLAKIDISFSTNDSIASFGGIAKAIVKGSMIKRCFVTGKVENSGYGRLYFYGITADCSESTIRECAVGRFILTGTNVSWNLRIIGPNGSGHTLENNSSVDSNPGTDEINGRNGKTVAAALFKQRYFEHTLNWDFDTVWQWDDKEDRPALRSVGVGAPSQQAKPKAQQANMVDLLTQQISANIWL